MIFDRQKLNLKKFIIPLVFLAMSFAFFFKLFYPKISLFYTPDFNRSDVFDIGFSLKYFLSQSLKNHQLPLWTNLIATGFPVLAEGQIGTFFLPNLLLFYFLDPVVAFNLSYVLAFFLVQWGMFLLLKQLKLSFWSAFFGAIVFSFSGFFVSHVRHLNIIQAASLTPWLFLLVLKFCQTKNLKSLLFFSLILSQQIFTGHFQTVFISLLALAIYFTPKLFHKKKLLIFILLAILVSFLFASIQLLPTIELTKNSVRSGGLSFDKVVEFSYPYKHILSFISPFYFGNPSLGTYPFSFENLGIFWENTFYLGVIPLILVTIGCFLKLKQKKGLFVLIFLSFLLGFGKHSPLYFFFTMMPFNFFRIPSRYFFIAVFGLVIISSLSLDYLKNKIPKALFFTIIIFSFWQLWDFHQQYPEVVLNKNVLLKPPAIVSYLEKEENQRFWLSHKAQNYVWFNLLKFGWQKPEGFLSLRNSLSSYSSLVFDIPTINLLEDNSPKASSFMFDLVEKSTILDESASSIFISPATIKLLQLTSTPNILTPLQINSLPESIDLIQSFSEQKNQVFFYKLKSVPSKIRFIKEIKSSQTIVDFVLFLKSENFDPFTSAASTEESLTDKKFSLPQNQPKIMKQTPDELVVETKTENESFLLVGESFYPGWKASIDGQKTTIFPININQRGIIVPPGNHQISFRYQPNSLIWGTIISFFSVVTVALFVFLFPNKNLKID